MLKGNRYIIKEGKLYELTLWGDDPDDHSMYTIKRGNQTMLEEYIPMLDGEAINEEKAKELFPEYFI